MADNQQGYEDFGFEEWEKILAQMAAETETLEALEQAAEVALADTITEVVTEVGEMPTQALVAISQWNEEELAYLKERALEVFEIVRNGLMSEGYDLEDAARMALDETMEVMKGEFAASEALLRGSLAALLEGIDEEEEEEEEEGKGIAQTIKDKIGGLLGEIAEALVLCFEWLAERLEDLLRIPGNVIFEWLADVLPGGLRG